MRKRITESIEGVQVIPHVLVMLWRAGHSFTLGLLGLTFIEGIIPLAQIYVGKLILDSIVSAITSGGTESVKRAIIYIAVELGIVLVNTGVAQGRTLLQTIFQDRFTNYMNALILERTIELDLSYYEDADYHDRIQKAQRDAVTRPMGLLTTCFNLSRQIVTSVSMVTLLVLFQPWALLVVIMVAVPNFLAAIKYSHRSFLMLDRRMPESREANYFYFLLTNEYFKKENILFGLGHYFLERYKRAFAKFHKENTRLAVKKSGALAATGFLATFGTYGFYVFVVLQAVRRTITIGDMNMYYQAFSRCQTLMTGILTSVSQLYEDSLFIRNLFGFMKLEPRIFDVPGSKPFPPIVFDGLELRNVSFRYPGSDKLSIVDVSLSIKPDETLALVGENGAGKTTLVKLIARLYDPTEGEIILDGRDIREYQLSAYREHIGPIFQDFNRYQLTAQENIGLGRLEALYDRDRVARSAERGKIREEIERLPHGFNTRLGKWFEGGEELSIGQWQRVALARAFMRDAPILILDEPTSALDARMEYRIYENFRRLAKGKIVIIISHRFSTVRMADRIAVLHNGRLVEIGSHDELMSSDGSYARLYSLQASAYR